MGTEEYEATRASLGDTEPLQFAAEERYQKRSPTDDLPFYLRTITLNKVEREHAAVSELLRRAEGAGDVDKAEQLNEQSRLLAAEIARLRKER